MNPEPSLLGDELFRCRYRPRAEIVVPGAGNAHETLGCPDQAIETLAERYGNDSIVFTVHHERWRRDLPNAQVRAELVLHDDPHRREPVVPCADIGGRGERGFKHDAPDRLFRRERDCERRAERFAPYDDALGWIARDSKRIGCRCILDKARLGRSPARAALPAGRRR